MNQCVMCGELNELSRKSCKSCKCRKYLKPCSPLSWEKTRNQGGRCFYFKSGMPKDSDWPDYELQYCHSSYVKGWILFYREVEVDTNTTLGYNDVEEAKQWATSQIHRRNY